MYHNCSNFYGANISRIPKLNSIHDFIFTNPPLVRGVFGPCRVPVKVTLILCNEKAIITLRMCMGTMFTSRRHR